MEDFCGRKRRGEYLMHEHLLAPSANLHKLALMSVQILPIRGKRHSFVPR